ncbi:MAG: HIT domain-containing protein [Candidatus Paceibacterota bacterium]
MSIFESFAVEGVNPSDIWQLFNCSNYHYFYKKVQDLRVGRCGFCNIDLKFNTVHFETEHWVVMENTIAPQAGQEHQFVIPCRRHVQSFSELTFAEVCDLLAIVQKIDRDFNITGSVSVMRSGDPARNARSMPHFHFNHHVPTGKERVEITIAKSEKDLQKKLPILLVFKKMLENEEAGKDKLNGLSPEEFILIDGKIAPKGSC